ncbi:MAG: CotH kinase family protein [Myxococcota bacterium]
MLLLLACVPAEDDDAPGVIAPVGGDDTGLDVIDDTDTTVADDTGEPPEEEDPPPPQLVINEVMTENSYTLKVDGAYPDWIEIYNPTAETVAMTRLTLVDGSGLIWMGTEGELAPGTYTLVYADSADNGLHAPFSLDQDGDVVTLGVDGYVVDRIATGEIDEDLSWARIPDGGDWYPTAWTTPGETNGDEPSDTLDPMATLFTLQQVHQVHLDLGSSGYQALRSSPTTYTEINSFTLGDSMIEDVGVRLAGSMTYQPITSKARFKVDFNRYGDHRFRGLKKINLLNMYYEPSYVCEYLGYYVFESFEVPAPRNAYAWVTVNDGSSDLDYGLYLFSETYDDVWLDYWYGNSGGYLWEPNYGDITSGSGSWDCEEGACDTSVIEPIADLMRSSATDANVAEIELYLDLEESLREIAVELAIGQWDGYCAVHNYRLYWDPDTELVTIIPSSLDLTFDNYGDYGDDLYSCSGSLLSWCLSNEGCEERYNDILLDLADQWESESWDLLGKIDEIETLIDSYAYDDDAIGRAQYSYAQHLSNLDRVRTYVINQPDVIRSAVANR